MNTQIKNTINNRSANLSPINDPFINVNYKCLLPNQENHKCNHWGCKVTAKKPHYYPSWSEVFANRKVEAFHIHPSLDSGKGAKEALPINGYLTGMQKSSDTPNLNTGFMLEAVGKWPNRSVYSFDEVQFIHVEYDALRGKTIEEIKVMLLKGGKIELNKTVKDVKEVAVFIGKEAINV